VRDDLYPMTRAEGRSALAGWHAIPRGVRWETGRLAERGLPGRDPWVSFAARRYGEYLLKRHLINRMPRSALPVLGVLVAVVGTLAGLGLVALPGGLTAAALGLLSWGQRRAGRMLVAVNAPVPDVVQP
jgi:hypothetical protein